MVGNNMNVDNTIPKTGVLYWKGGGTGWVHSTTLCFLTTNKKWDQLQHAPATVPFLLL